MYRYSCHLQTHLHKDNYFKKVTLEAQSLGVTLLVALLVYYNPIWHFFNLTAVNTLLQPVLSGCF